MQSKLADNNNLSIFIPDAFVHETISVIKDPQVNNLVGQPFTILIVIGFFNSYQNQ
jgi:hypothetical protein